MRGDAREGGREGERGRVTQTHALLWRPLAQLHASSERCCASRAWPALATGATGWLTLAHLSELPRGSYASTVTLRPPAMWSAAHATAAALSAALTGPLCSRGCRAAAFSLSTRVTKAAAALRCAHALRQGDRRGGGGRPSRRGQSPRNPGQRRLRCERLTAQASIVAAPAVALLPPATCNQRDVVAPTCGTERTVQTGRPTRPRTPTPAPRR